MPKTTMDSAGVSGRVLAAAFDEALEYPRESWTDWSKQHFEPRGSARHGEHMLPDE